jgi:hypothetical protein
MVEKDKIVTEKIKRVGVFHFKETYQFMYKWLIEEDYWIEEEKYVEEVTGDTKKIEIIWSAHKKISDYFRNDIKLTWTILNMKNVEVEKDGKRVKMNEASFEVKFVGSLVKDYKSTWEKNPMTKFFRGVYDKFIIEGRIEKYEDKLFGDVKDLIQDTKGFLAIEGNR